MQTHPMLVFLKKILMKETRLTIFFKPMSENGKGSLRHIIIAALKSGISIGSMKLL